MIMNTNQEWVERQEETSEARREYEYERLTVWALDELYEAMERNGLTKADLARKLGTSRANITQTFSGERNITLRTLSDLAWACGVRARVKVEPLRAGEFISSPVMVVEPRQRVVTAPPEADCANDSVYDEIELMAVGGGS
jgi:transcriptional regulator with XRE-family HTH domain